MRHETCYRVTVLPSVTVCDHFAVGTAESACFLSEPGQMLSLPSRRALV